MTVLITPTYTNSFQKLFSRKIMMKTITWTFKGSIPCFIIAVPGHEASGDRHITWRSFSMGAAVQGKVCWLWPTGRMPLSRSLTVPRGTLTGKEEAGTRASQAKAAQCRGWRARAQGGHTAGPARSPAWL